MTAAFQESIHIDDFYLPPTDTTPMAVFDPLLRIMQFRGSCCTESVPQFYKKIYQWFDHDELNKALPLVVDMSLNKFDVHSCKCLFMIFRKLNQLRMKGVRVSINWYFKVEDRDMIMTGEGFSHIFNLEFNLVEIE